MLDYQHTQLLVYTPGSNLIGLYTCMCMHTHTTGAAAPSTISLSDDSLNLDTLLIQLHSEVTLKWREFGQAVGLAEELLDKYSMYPPEECIVEVLDVWLRNYNCSDRDTDNNNMRRKPTWRDVAKALREIELHQLADNILDKNGNCYILE